jgi:hypothetical protein
MFTYVSMFQVFPHEAILKSPHVAFEETEETPRWDEKLQAMQRLEVDRELLRGISLRTDASGGILHIYIYLVYIYILSIYIYYMP